MTVGERRKVEPKSCPFIVNTEYLFLGKVTRCYTVNETPMLWVYLITLRVLLPPERPTVGRRGKFLVRSVRVRVFVYVLLTIGRRLICPSTWIHRSHIHGRRASLSRCFSLVVCRVNPIIENMCVIIEERHRSMICDIRSMQRHVLVVG